MNINYTIYSIHFSVANGGDEFIEFTFIVLLVEIIIFSNLQISLNRQVDVCLMLISVKPYRKSTQF